MSPDEFALMQAIRANPADDLPRLVYADYLEERGDESSIARAEFIRVQCAGTNPERAEALLAAYRERWDEQLLKTIVNEFPSLQFGEEVLGWHYRHGMVASLEIAEHVLDQFPDLPKHMGPIDHLVIHLNAVLALPIENAGRGWDFDRLKIIEYRSQLLSTDQLYAAAQMLISPIRSLHSSVPILRIVTEQLAPDSFSTPLVALAILEGLSNPILIIEIMQSGSHFQNIVLDPLDLWPTFGKWAEEILNRRWERVRVDLRPELQSRLPSLRLRHLVRYYQLAGLPPPSDLTATPYPMDERERPKRSILTRATRWIRGKR